MTFRSNQAFTLIELLVVISIVGLLSSIVVSSLNASREKGRIGAARHFASQVEHIAGEQAVGIWNFEEGPSGTTAEDSSGFGYGGVISNAVWSTTGHRTTSSYSINTAGNTAANIQTSLPASVIGDNFTISAWVYATAFRTSSLTIENRVVTAFRSPAPSSRWAFGTESGTFTLFFANQAESIIESTGGSSLSLNKWYHMAVTYNGSVMTGYLDGVKDAETPAGTIYSGTSGGLMIGTFNPADPTTSNRGNWQGLIDDVRAYSKILTASEISELYAAEAPKFKMASQNR